MKTQGMLGLFALGALALVGCSSARTPDVYSDETHKLVASKNDAIKACYDAQLKKSPKDTGSVTVHFTVQQATGKIVDVKVDDKAPPALGACVMQAVDGLVLAPADPNDGVATFTWDFTLGAPG